MASHVFLQRDPPWARFEAGMGGDYCSAKSPNKRRSIRDKRTGLVHCWRTLHDAQRFHRGWRREAGGWSYCFTRPAMKPNERPLIPRAEEMDFPVVPACGELRIKRAESACRCSVCMRLESSCARPGSHVVNVHRAILRSHSDVPHTRRIGGPHCCLAPVGVLREACCRPCAAQIPLRMFTGASSDA